MASNKISKSELAEILKRISVKDDYDSMQETIETIADEYGIDLTEVDDPDEVQDIVDGIDTFVDIEMEIEDDIDFLFNTDDEDEDY